MKQGLVLSNSSKLFVLRDGVGERIREARTSVGLKQKDLAPLGGIARATQISYESGTTSPTTDYLQKVQTVGLDVPFVLFGHLSEELENRFTLFGNVDWETIKEAFEHVDFFCLRVAPQLPPRFKWQLVSHLYRYLQSRSLMPGAKVSDKEVLDQISTKWNSMASG